MRKFGILVTSTALTLGIATSIGHAQSPYEVQNEKVAIEVQNNEVEISKNVLIQKLKSVFPKQFDFLANSDFQLGNAHHYPDDDRIRYDLSFHKTVKGKDVYGSVTFVGDELEIENFYFEPIDTSEALFPAKVSKEDARKIATDFLKNFPDGKNYEIDETNVGYHYYSNQLITEPIRYEFSFVKKHNDIPISNQRVYVTVLGNGEITQLYRDSQTSSKATYANSNLVKSEQTILDKVKKNLSVSLKYQINYNYITGEESVALVYHPSINYNGLNAITGEWQTTNGFTKEAPKVAKIEKLTSKPLSPKYNGITIQEAKKIAQNLLKIDSDKVELKIDSVHEYENNSGQPFLSIQYSYNWEYGGYGSTIEMNKKTGEIVSYHDMRGDVLRELGENTNKDPLSKKEALNKAIEHVKNMIPSYIHDYAKPIDEPYLEKGRGIYNFAFPRVVNGIIVEGNQISVSVGPDGSLYSLYVNHLDRDNWPSTKNIITSENAKNQFINALSLNLQYMKLDPEATHYELIYSPVYNESQFSYLDAITGKWSSILGESDQPVVTHPSAEEELNFLIQNKILEVKDSNSFNADTSITNGEALKIIVKSLSHFYVYDTVELEKSVQTFDNIGPKHKLYTVVEQAVRMGILDSEDSFNPDSNLTKEQLAVWYIRTLGLELAAKNYDIYKSNLLDLGDTKSEYIGYITLSYSLKLISAENNQFKPKSEVTYADIATSIFTLARSIHHNKRYY